MSEKKFDIEYSNDTSKGSASKFWNDVRETQKQKESNGAIIERLITEMIKKDREIQQKVFDEVCWSLMMSGDFSQVNIDKEIKKSFDKIEKEKEDETN